MAHNYTYWEKQYNKIQKKKLQVEVRSNCFWYRPWYDMSAVFHQCELSETSECPCTADCDWFISKEEVDRIIYTRQDVEYHCRNLT